MAKPKPRRPSLGRGLPPPPRLSPEEEAEEDRIRAKLIVESIRIEAIFAQKRAEAQERRRLREMREAEGIVDPSPWS